MGNRCYSCHHELVVPSNFHGLKTVICPICGAENKFGSFVRKMVKERKDHD